MIDLDELTAYAQRWIVLHRENKYQREAAKIMQRVVDALKSVRAERDAALARIAELEKSRDRWEELCGKIASEKYDLNARIAEAAKLHQPEVIGVHEGYGEENWCPHCEKHWPCPTVAALDGAPEPEWEVQYGRRNRETGALHWLTGDPSDDWWHENQDRYEHVKRYISPPLPVTEEERA